MSAAKGRPRKYDFAEYTDALPKVTRAATDRGRQDAILAMRAATAIEEIANSEDTESELRMGLEPVLREGRPSVFTELGRIMVEEPNEEDAGVFYAALFLVAMNHGMSAKRLIRKLRALRLGDGGLEAVDALTHAISRVVDQYRERYPDLSLYDVDDALKTNLKAVETVRKWESEPASDNERSDNEREGWLLGKPDYADSEAASDNEEEVL